MCYQCEGGGGGSVGGPWASQLSAGPMGGPQSEGVAALRSSGVSPQIANFDAQTAGSLTINPYYDAALGKNVAYTLDELYQLTSAHPNSIRYAQETYSPRGKIRDAKGKWTGEYYNVDENIARLVNEPDFDLPPIRVFVKTDEMNGWGPLTDEYGHTGNPINLENGMVYTLDHRRLVAYREARRTSIPIVWATEKQIRDERYKFSTTNKGVGINRTGPKDDVEQ